MLYKSIANVVGPWTVREGGLPLNTSNDALDGHLQRALLTHFGTQQTTWPDGPYHQRTFPKHMVYSHKGQTYQVGYTAEHGAAGSEPKITLGSKHDKVHVAYVKNTDQAKESLSLILAVPDGLEEDLAAIEAARTGKLVYYTEKQVNSGQDGLENVIESIDLAGIVDVKESDKPATIPIKIIGEGWGSSAYYSKKVLQEAAHVFKAGTHMMWNHQSVSEEADRPEGDLRNLAAVLVENAKWDDNGPKGPGLYSKAKVFSDYSKAVMEKGPHIGVSVNAGIRCHEGTIDGRTGKIADKFVTAYSTDFVTKPGAGGAPVVPVYESASQAQIIITEVNMTVAEATALQATVKAMEARLGTLETENSTGKAENARLKTKQEAISAVSSKLHEAGITIKPRLLEAACSEPVIKEGKIDSAWVDQVVGDFTESFSGASGEVTGMGTRTREAAGEVKEDEVSEVLEALGIPKAGMEAAMAGGR